MNSKNKIPLRQFYKNIDDYIINQASEMAVSYSLFLLEKFPKNIFVYQLLGKAFLDLKEYDKALLLFEKILEIEPDDFLSHIGISLISENFGNVEKALDSMLRAYELQPSNETLQKEVKRITEEKDGFAPEKIRLSRGALIKMYARSKLSEQAIAEANLGLHESPDRIDYKIQLANMLQLSGKDNESIEKCLEILHTNPYCKPALEILYKNFVASDNLEDANLYKSRISELDPYFSFMKPETESVDNIPDIALMIEETGIPESTIEDIQLFIDKTWSAIDEESVISENMQSKDEDWEQIVEIATANNGIGQPIDDLDSEEISVDELKEVELPNANEFITIESKLDKFKNKLQSKNEKDADSAEEIPEWILEENPILEDGSLIGDASKSTSEFQEDGMTDHQIPINPALTSDNFKDNVSDWKTDVTPSHSIDLDDTQKIKIVKDDPVEILDQLSTTLEKNDTKFALACIHSLIQKESSLKDLSEILENHLAQNPNNIELWLELVRIYHDLNEKEKALAALEKAQSNISI